MVRVLLVFVLALVPLIWAAWYVRRLGGGAGIGKYVRAFAVLAAFLVLIFLPMFLFSQVISIRTLYQFGVNSFVNSVGVPIWLARGIVFALILPFLWAAKAAISPKRSRSRLGRIVLVGFVAGYCLTMYKLQEQTYFDHATGEATKYYCLTPEGYRVFDSPGFDPRYGIPLIRMDAAAARTISSSGGAIPHVEEGSFFDPVTGGPLKWCYRAEDGSWEFFDKPGYHPRYGEPLEAVTRELANEYFAWQAEHEEAETARREKDARERRDKSNREAAEAYQLKYVGAGCRKVAGKLNVMLVLADSYARSGKMSGAARTARFEKAIRAGGYACHPSMFKAAAMSDGLLEDLFAGNMGPLSRLGICNCVDRLLLCREGREFSQDSRLGGMVTCAMTIEYRLIECSGSTRSGSLKVSGIGTDRDDARENAAKRLTPQLAAVLGG